MRLSKLFTKTRKEAPSDEEAKNAKLLIRAGFVYKEMAGVYTLLPLGLRVLKKIEKIIREEMDAIGGQEILMAALQDPFAWKKSGRWEEAAVDNWFKTRLTGGGELGLANTHEEPLVSLLTHYVNSYKDLPFYIYQFQTKFRNELRAKSGIMRAREFLMKDLYSFSRTEDEFKEFYEKCASSYLKIFKRVGIGHITYRTAAAGGSFTDGLTDEFQTLSQAGEDIIYVDKENNFAINKEIYTDEKARSLGLNRDCLEECKSIEVGNIFPLGTKYSETLGLEFKDENGKTHYPIMGSYGIGLGRLMGTVAETLSDKNGLVWPKEISPFDLSLIYIGDNTRTRDSADVLYKALIDSGIEVLYDDRENVSAGEKFADADLIGASYRAVMSERIFTDGKIEIKDRASGKVKFISKDELSTLGAKTNLIF